MNSTTIKALPAIEEDGKKYFFPVSEESNNNDPTFWDKLKFLFFPRMGYKLIIVHDTLVFDCSKELQAYEKEMAERKEAAEKAIAEQEKARMTKKKNPTQ